MLTPGSAARAGRLWTSRAPLTKEPRACVRLLPIHYSPRGCVPRAPLHCVVVCRLPQSLRARVNLQCANAVDVLRSLDKSACAARVLCASVHAPPFPVFRPGTGGNAAPRLTVVLWSFDQAPPTATYVAGKGHGAVARQSRSEGHHNTALSSGADAGATAEAHKTHTHHSGHTHAVQVRVPTHVTTHNEYPYATATPKRIGWPRGSCG